MPDLYYITTNQDKLNVARKYLSPFEIEVVGKSYRFQEIQSTSIEEIAIHKAKQAFHTLKHPLFVNDASWSIQALNGFPGPYMKYINQWFDEDDLLRLMENKKDRKVIYQEVFCYIDNANVKTFIGEIVGKILRKPQGEGVLSWTLISLSPSEKSIAQCWNEGIDPVDNYGVWKKFADWYSKLE